MGCAEVERFLKDKQLDYPIIRLEESSATVDLAAAALGVQPAMIAKTLAFVLPEQNIVIVTCGTARIDNRKFKDCFHTKAKMTGYEETLAITGHPVGGVCPFGLPEGVAIYLDESLKAFEYVYPAAGDGNSALKIAPAALGEVTGGIWVDITKQAE